MTSIVNFRPDLMGDDQSLQGDDRLELSIRSILINHYRRHIDDVSAKNLAEQYIAELEKQFGSQITHEVDEVLT